MRHRSKSHGFARRQGPRIALIRGLVYSLVENGRIKTTVAKAKEIRRHVEKAITVSKKNSLHARRILLSRYPNHNVVEILTSDLAPRFANRNGGYTRIIKIGRRPGDSAPTAFIEFVDYVVKAKGADADEAKGASKKASKKAKAEDGAEKKKTVTKKASSGTSKKKIRKKQSSARKKTRSRTKI